MTEAEQEITNFVTAEFLQDKPHITLTSETDLIDTEVLDSLAIFILIAYLEDRFGVDIEPNDITFDNFRSVGVLGELVRTKQPA